MANNRLWLKNTKTGESFLLAKGFGLGWCKPASEGFCDSLFEWLRDNDVTGGFGVASATELIIVTEASE